MVAQDVAVHLHPVVLFITLYYFVHCNDIRVTSKDTQMSNIKIQPEHFSYDKTGLLLSRKKK